MERQRVVEKGKDLLQNGKVKLRALFESRNVLRSKLASAQTYARELLADRELLKYENNSVKTNLHLTLSASLLHAAHHLDELNLLDRPLAIDDSLMEVQQQEGGIRISSQRELGETGLSQMLSISNDLTTSYWFHKNQLDVTVPHAEISDHADAMDLLAAANRGLYAVIQNQAAAQPDFEAHRKAS